jgi:hypothetical protein
LTWALISFAPALSHSDFSPIILSFMKKQMIRINGLLGFRGFDLVNTILHSLPTDLLEPLDADSGFICSDDKGFCLPDEFALDIAFEDDFPSLSLDGVNIDIPDEFLGYFGTFDANIESWEGLWDDLLNAGVECEEYSYLPINPVDAVSNALSINLTDLRMPACEYNFKVCSKIKMMGINDFESKVLGLLQTSFADITGNRRLSDGWESWDNAFCRGPANNWGLGIPLSVPIKVISTIFKTILPMRQVSRSFENYLSEDEANWVTYWKFRNAQLGNNKYIKKALPFNFEFGPLHVNLLDFSVNILIGVSVRFGCDLNFVA